MGKPRTMEKALPDDPRRRMSREDLAAFAAKVEALRKEDPDLTNTEIAERFGISVWTLVDRIRRHQGKR